MLFRPRVSVCVRPTAVLWLAVSLVGLDLPLGTARGAHGGCSQACVRFCRLRLAATPGATVHADCGCPSRPATPGASTDVVPALPQRRQVFGPPAATRVARTAVALQPLALVSPPPDPPPRHLSA